MISIRPTEPEPPPDLARGRRMMLVSLPALLALFGLLVLRVDVLTACLVPAAAAAAWLLHPPLARFAVRTGLVSRPGGRQAHLRDTPTAAGAAFVLLTSVALLHAALAGETRAWGVLAGGALVFAIGLWDDLRGVPPRAKVVVQLLAAGCLLAAGFEVTRLQLVPFGTLELGVLGLPLVLLWVLLATNAFNLVDGVDGLAGGIALLGALTLALVGVWPTVLLVLAGALVAFLYFNLPRARVFMGDSGSLYLGFLLAAGVLALPAERIVPLGLAVFAYPLGDVALTLTRRIVRGQPLWRPDRSHIHHKLLAHLGSAAPALLLALLFVTVEILVALAYPGLSSVLVVLLGWAATGVLLVAAGQYSVSSVMATRGPVQRAHAVTRYTRDMIRLATRTHHVETALLHLIEGMGVARLSLPAVGLDLTNRMQPAVAERLLRFHRVSVCVGEAHWSESRHEYDPRVEIERETVMVELVRQAAERLHYLTSDAHLTTVAGSDAGTLRLGEHAPPRLASEAPRGDEPLRVRE